jgi:hypothetical protein
LQAVFFFDLAFGVVQVTLDIGKAGKSNKTRVFGMKKRFRSLAEDGFGRRLFIFSASPTSTGY